MSVDHNCETCPAHNISNLKKLGIAMDKFDLKNDNIEFIIEEIISILLSTGYLVERCITLRKKQ